MQALTKFDLVINLKTAKALGVTTSSSLRCTWSLLADSVAKVENRSAPKISRKSIFGRRYERLPALANELVRREVAVIVSIGGNASAVVAKSATQSNPIVIAIGGDPTKAGLVESLDRPGGISLA